MYKVIVSLLHACEAELHWYAGLHGAKIGHVYDEPNKLVVSSDNPLAVMDTINSVLDVNGIPLHIEGLPEDRVQIRI